MKIRFLCIFGIVIFATGTAAKSEDLLLVCQGVGSKRATNYQFLTLQDNQGNFVTGNSWGSGGTQNSQEMLKVKISGNGGVIQFPRSLLPPIHGGSKDGWFELKKLRIGEDEISASFDLNIINHPKITIDRLSGGISVTGWRRGFNGECQNFDPAIMKKKF